MEADHKNGRGAINDAFPRRCRRRHLRWVSTGSCDPAPGLHDHLSGVGRAGGSIVLPVPSRRSGFPGVLGVLCSVLV